MARFVINVPISTREPTVAVDAGLPIGRHRFRLEVVDAAGNRSRPSEAIVEVQQGVIDRSGRPAGPIVSPTPVRPRTRRKKDEP
jgi:hypothetical protein